MYSDEAKLQGAFMKIPKSLVRKGFAVVKKHVGPVVTEVVTSVAPVAERALDRFHEKKRETVDLSNVIDLPVEKAVSYLEDKGFVVHPVLLPPHSKHRRDRPDIVIDVVPKKAKRDAQILVKLYYIDKETLEQSHQMVELVNVVGMTLDRATSILEGRTFHVATLIAPAKKEYAQLQAEQVVAMKPAPSPFIKNVKKGSVVQLHYIDEPTLEKSRWLQLMHQEKILARNEKVSAPLLRVKKWVERKNKDGS